jgi:hypothetical protein
MLRAIKSRPYTSGITGTILSIGISWAVSMMIPSTFHNGISIFILAIALVVLIWAFVLPKKSSMRRGKMALFCIGIGMIVIGGAFVISQLEYSTDKKSVLQEQLDTLMADLVDYEKTIPPSPTPVYSADPIERDREWNEFTQQIIEHGNKVNADFFSKYNNRIADILIKLNNLKVITDSEFAETKNFINFAPTAHVGLPLLLENLQIYKSRLDELEKALNAR